MDRHHASSPRTITKAYGRGGFLGLLSPVLAFFMASRGMNGWQETAIRQMEDDAVAMVRRGYRVAATQEIGVPLLGITAYKVTYELMRP